MIVLDTNKPGNIVILNVTFKLTCHAEANPAAKYIFFDGEGKMLNRSVSGSYIAVVRNRIKRVIYGCLPHNELGNGSFNVVEVSVYCK